LRVAGGNSGTAGSFTGPVATAKITIKQPASPTTTFADDDGIVGGSA
jgi:hypothetical protein